MRSALPHESAFAGGTHDSREGPQAAETRFGRYTHDARHAAATHDTRFHAAHPRAPKPAHADTPHLPIRDPKPSRLHVAAAAQFDLTTEVLTQGHATRHPRPARHHTSQPPRHSKGSVHHRHLNRVSYQQELKTYHAALKEWKRILHERVRLLKKLESIEKALARRAHAKSRGRKTLPVEIYEIDGVWYKQTGRGKPRIINAPTMVNAAQ